MENIFEKEARLKEDETKVKEIINREHEIEKLPEADIILDRPVIKDEDRTGETGLVAEEKVVSINQTNGSMQVVDNNEDDEKIDFDNIELSEDEEKEIQRMIDEADMAAASITPAQIQNEIIKAFDFLSESEVKIFSDVVNRVRNKEVFSVYAALPLKIQKMINAQCGGNANRTDRNAKAREIVEDFVKEITASFTIDYMTKLMNKKKNEELKKLGNQIASGFLAGEVQRWGLYRIKANELLTKENPTDEEKDTAVKFESFTRAFEESYQMTAFINDIKEHRGKYKVKRIQLEKFKKECERFNIKYENSNYVVKDVITIVPVIMRLIDCDELTAKLIVLAFIKYTLSFRPENPCQHIFMHYFIANIILSDTATDEEDLKIVEEIRCGLNKLAGLL